MVLMSRQKLLIHSIKKPKNAVWVVILFGFLFAVPAAMAGEELSYNLLIFVASILLLVKSAEYLVEGSSSIARYFGIPTVIIGITVVAFGTSLPELTVSVIANLSGSAGISVGNIVGSNISNICLVLGMALVLVPIKIKKEMFGFDIPFLIGVSILLPLLSMKMVFDFSRSQYVLGIIDGLIMLVLFAFFMYIQVKSAEKHRIHHCDYSKDNSCKGINLSKVLGYVVVLVAGLAGVIVSAGLLVESGRGIASIFGVPEIIIGLTMIAVGTSLPELATNVVAAFRRKLDLAIGNVIGSNIFNILLVLGTSSVIKPIENIEEMAVSADMPIMVGVTILLVLLMKRGSELTRKEGLLLLSVYAAYIAYLITRL
jgi:cation:H+ antiporter